VTADSRDSSGKWEDVLYRSKPSIVDSNRTVNTSIIAKDPFTGDWHWQIAYDQFASLSAFPLSAFPLSAFPSFSLKEKSSIWGPLSSPRLR
jgi:hypothetical protein